VFLIVKSMRNAKRAISDDLNDKREREREREKVKKCENGERTFGGKRRTKVEET
jgi:hypothetical protein